MNGPTRANTGEEAYPVVSGTVIADDGTSITLIVPANTPPTEEEAATWRALWDKYVTPLDMRYGQKGPVRADVPVELAPAMRRAMDFMGAIVDDEMPLLGGIVRLYSCGYYAHGF